MPRVLVMSERTVTDVERVMYLQTLAVRRERAAAASANFWVFEQCGGRGLFLEFLEAASIDVLQSLVASLTDGKLNDAPANVVWREVAGPD